MATTRIRGRALQALRKRHLSADPLCVICASKGLITLATQLDHITALVNGGSNDDDNMQGLCDACHTTKSRSDLGYAPRAHFGSDGRVVW